MQIDGDADLAGERNGGHGRALAGSTRARARISPAGRRYGFVANAASMDAADETLQRAMTRPDLRATGLAVPGHSQQPTTSSWHSNLRIP